MANEKSLGNGNNENHQAEHTKQLKETCCKNDNRTLRENGYNLPNHTENCQVFVSGFPGATARCMQDHVQPTTRANSDQIIVHVCVCVCVCLFPFRLLLTVLNNKCNARDQASDVVLRKYFCAMHTE